MISILKAILLSTVFLTYSFIESADVVATRYPILVSIIHLSLIGWPLLSIVSNPFFMQVIRNQEKYNLCYLG